jgi:hypothetical protein
LSATHFVIVLHVVEDERGVVEKFDRGGESDAMFGRKFEAGGEVEAETGTDALAPTGEDVGGGLSEVARSLGGIGEELFDECEFVSPRGGGAEGGRHGERAEGGNLKPEGGEKSGRGSGSPGRGEMCVSV